MWLFIISTVIVAAVVYKLFFSDKTNFWTKRGIRYIDTTPAISKLDVLLTKKCMTLGDDYAYQEMGSDKVCGIIDMGTPMLLIKDVELIKKVFIKDFNHFVDRRQFFSEEDGLLKHMLPSLQGDEWKGVRAAISPTFTTGKIRKMMDSFNSVAKEWVEEYTRKAKQTSNGSITIDPINAVNSYTVEVISNNVFGMSAGVIKNPDSVFGKMANNMAQFSKFQLFKFGIRALFPKISQRLRLSMLNKESMDFFERILEQGLKSRMSGETKNNDFIQLLVEAKKGELEAETEELSSFEKDAQIVDKNLQKKQYLTDKVMVAQSVVFFFAGFSTTSNFITFSMYALALNPSVQDRLRKEVDKIVKEDGNLDHDDVLRLVYLDMVVCEVLRKFPAAGRLERVCVQEYRDEETGVVISKGTTVAVPINSIHHDRAYYDNPDNFDPEHFSPEKKAARSPYAFLPFGMGPRNCIGMRFALIEIKSALAHIVHHFLIEPTVMTPRPLNGEPAGLQLVPPKKLELKLTPINNK